MSSKSKYLAGLPLSSPALGMIGIVMTVSKATTPSQPSQPHCQSYSFVFSSDWGSRGVQLYFPQLRTAAVQTRDFLLLNLSSLSSKVIFDKCVKQCHAALPILEAIYQSTYVIIPILTEN